jgi:RNA polymerase sigma-70 factor (ECF subfamily)
MSHPGLRAPAAPVGGPPETGEGQLTLLLAAEVPQLRRFATAWLGDVSEAERLVKAAVERALAEREHLTGGSTLRAQLLWWLRQVREVPLEAGRRPDDRPSFTSRGRLEEMIEQLSPVDRPEARTLMAGLAGLGEMERQVVLLVDLEGLSYREVGSVLAIPLGQVVSHLVEGRETLRQAFAAPAPARAGGR